MPDTWITFEEAVRIVTETRGASRGRAEALVRSARKSGEVRPPLSELGADDGLLIFDVTALVPPAPARFSKDDFVFWLDRQEPPAEPEETTASTRPKPDQERVRTAAAALWGQSGPPLTLRTQMICNQIRDWLKANGHQSPSDSTIKRALGLKTD